MTETRFESENSTERKMTREAAEIKKSWSESDRAKMVWADLEQARVRRASQFLRGSKNGLRRVLPYAAGLIIVFSAALSGPIRALAEQAWRFITRTPEQAITIRPTDDWFWQRDGKRLAAAEVRDVAGFDPATPNPLPDTEMEITGRLWYEEAGRLLTPFVLRDGQGETAAIPLLTEFRSIDGTYRFYRDDQVPESVETEQVRIGQATGEYIPGGWLSDDPREPYEQRWTDRLVQLRWQEGERLLSLEIFRGSLTREELIELARRVE